MLKKYSTLAAIFLFFMTLYTWVDRVNEGFNSREITSSQSFVYDMLPVAISDIERDSLKLLFNQKFHYIGKGCQFYVFESEDRSHVIKLPKQKHLRDYQWALNFKLPSFLRKICERKTQRKKEKILRLFNSCKLAYEELKEETGIVYLQLSKSNEWKKQRVTLVDKLGFNHVILLSDHCFMVQKKADDVASTLSQEPTSQEIQDYIHQLAEVVVKRCKKGIRDNDRAFVQNVAFAIDHSQAVFIDVGQFVKDESIKTSEHTVKEVKKRMVSLGLWMEQNFPDYLPLVYEEIAHLEKEYKDATCNLDTYT